MILTWRRRGQGYIDTALGRVVYGAVRSLTGTPIPIIIGTHRDSIQSLSDGTTACGTVRDVVSSTERIR